MSTGISVVRSVSVAPLAGVSWGDLVSLVISLTTIYAVCKSIYNLFFHPLAKFPGPKFAAISNFNYAYHWMGGRYPFHIEGLHKIFGDVVRIAPNELSFATAQSFADIYSHASKDHKPFIKSTFYEHPQPEPGIVAERDPERHRETRKLLAHGFSAKALKDQESILQEYTDLFISQIDKLGGEAGGLNMKQWFNWLSFDIIGELSFGESFGAVKSAKSHFWIDTIHDGGILVTLFEIGRRLPLAWPFILLSLPKGIRQKFNLFLEYSRKQVRSRVARRDEITRQDFFVNILSDKAGPKSEEWLLAQANVLVIAGSDTTATALTTIIYFLSTNLGKLAELQKEIRSTFTNQEEIEISLLQMLPYLTAVIEEGLRIFPPTAFGLPRLSPGAMVDGNFVPNGTIVSTSSWTTTHSETYFHRPRDFVPERWLSPEHPLHLESYDNDNTAAARPFSLGPRGCLGVNLANMELRVTLAKLVFSFDWTLVNADDIDWERDAKFEGFWHLPAPKLRFKKVCRTEWEVIERTGKDLAAGGLKN